MEEADKHGGIYSSAIFKWIAPPHPPPPPLNRVKGGKKAACRVPCRSRSSLARPDAIWRRVQNGIDALALDYANEVIAISQKFSGRPTFKAKQSGEFWANVM